MYRLILIAAAIFLGRYAVRSLGAVRTAAILRRLFWVCYFVWCALALYAMVWTPLHTYRAADVDRAATAAPATQQTGHGLPAGYTLEPPAKQQGQYSANDLAPGQAEPLHVVSSEPAEPLRIVSSIPDPSPTQQPWQSTDDQSPTATKLKPQHLPVDWKLASSLLAAPLLLWCAVIFICTGKLTGLRTLFRYGLILLTMLFMAFVIFLRIFAFFPVGLLFQWVIFKRSARGYHGGLSFLEWLVSPLVLFAAWCAAKEGQQ
jgi:hypothetical protein